MILSVTNVKVSHLVKTCHLQYYIKRCEKHFNVIGLNGRVVRWCWVNFQFRGVLHFGLQ